MHDYTTLDLVLHISNGKFLIPLKRTADILGLESQTIRNRLSENKFSLSPVRDGRSIFFQANEIADLIDSMRSARVVPKKGRPKKSVSCALKNHRT